MTQQATDRIIYEGRTLPMIECPLDGHEGAKALSKRFVVQSTDNWRGYIATWALQDGWLYLTEIDGFLTGESREPALSDLVPGHSGPLVADWFTGTLTIGDGRRIGSEYEYGPDIHERTIRLVIHAGQHQTTEIIHNSTAPGQQVPDWPRRRWFTVTQAGHDEYIKKWLAKKRSTPLISNVPLYAIEDYRAAVELARERGWHDIEQG